MKKPILTLLVLFTSCIISQAQLSKKESKNKKKEHAYQEILDLVHSEKYEFRGQKASPQRGPQIDLTTRENFLRIVKGTAIASLPYFGRAFSGGYSGSDGGIKFDGPMDVYDVKKNDKKRRITIQFKIKGSDDTYNGTLSISSMRNASLSITSNKRQRISYTGLVRELPEGQ